MADDHVPQAAEDIAEVYRRVSPSVVSIEVEIGLFDDASGTGFVVDELGHVVTNAHVVEDARRIHVIFHDGAKASAVLIGMDTLLDVAVLKVNTVASRLKPVTFGDSDDLAIGQSVLAIGNPFGLEATLTRGIIGGLKREIEFDDGSILKGMIQTDAAIAPGSSGGPLLSLSGEVIGVNSAGFGGRFGGTNFGFAIPSNTVKRISERMIARATNLPTLTSWPTQSVTWTSAPAVQLSVTASAVAIVTTPTDTPVPTGTNTSPGAVIATTPTDTPVPTDTNTPPPTNTPGDTAVIVVPCKNGISIDVIGVDARDLTQVTIYASVLDWSEQLISGLGVDNLSIGGDLAGLAEVKRVENVSDDELSFASVLAIDTSGSMADESLSNALAAARDYLNALGPNDPVALVTFNDRVRLMVNYTTDREAIFAQFENLAYGGQTALYDATVLAVELATEAPLPLKAVILLSDGGEYGNVSEHSRQDAIRAATIHGVPVYSIGLGWDIDQRFLEAIAAESNAEFYNAPLPEELGQIYSNLAFLFRSQYIVTISTDVPADGARYDFMLNVSTADGQCASGAATLPTVQAMVELNYQEN